MTDKSFDNNEILAEQKKYAERVRTLLLSRPAFSERTPKVYITTFGCQQNEADSERLLGQAVFMGYEKTDAPENADLIIYNTCAVREHAELRALSRTGQLKALKKQNPELIIGLWGCMVSQDHRMNDVKMSYPYVDFVAGTNMLHRLCEIVCDVMESEKRRYYVTDEQALTVEGVPVVRSNEFKAYVSIMYGCNNFCTYCVVPHVRGRERSREKSAILSEIRELIDGGYREITLLGQNVNSYKASDGTGFCELLQDICNIDGDFIVRFMTSHPKDASDDLIDIIAKNKKIARHFHLPVQSGSSRILSLMNRKYTAEHYLALAKRIKEKIPDISLTTDIIVGFPGETEEDFEKTLEMVRQVGYDSIYSFIYSPRKGTPAAGMEDPTSYEEKTERMARLLSMQTDISEANNKKLLGKVVCGICESKEKNAAGYLVARCSDNKIVFFENDEEQNIYYGKNVNIKITRATPAQLYGQTVK
ncbi:MAG: tRNA (N6-isopentenyl adenosine(37)-C2)-methylthiotransferase MiaB [Clostridia bacterium]|nr:tRNA (N6-isopentenyl adenosine(37)-C2)-methylthiotransferase MiaB [Clostridia bacterium]